MRQSRKLDHLRYSLQLSDGPAKTGFDDITLIHNCLPNLSADAIDLSGMIAGIPFHHPVIINAITGGADDVTAINAKLAQFAKQTHSIMAVGSQYAALENREAVKSYTIIREVYPDGIFIANLGAHASVAQARQAIDMIGAAALQIHLNVAQEMIMPEGDRNFMDYLENIADIVHSINIPVIVKEVGCGIALEQARLLYDIGVRIIDIGGAGGTNFIAIEAHRSSHEIEPALLNWGIPTAISAAEILSGLPETVDVIISGGIRTSLDVVKALALGGTAVSMATPILRKITQSEMDEAVYSFQNFLSDIKRCMLLAGAGRLEEIALVPVVITGYCREWLNARNIDITTYAVRHTRG